MIGHVPHLCLPEEVECVDLVWLHSGIRLLQSRLADCYYHHFPAFDPFALQRSLHAVNPPRLDKAMTLRSFRGQRFNLSNDELLPLPVTALVVFFGVVTR